MTIKRISFVYLLLIMFFVVIFWGYKAASLTPQTQEKSILFVNFVYDEPRFLVDPQYQKKLEADGWHVGYTSLQKLDWDVLSKFNVLVIQENPIISRTPNYQSIIDEKRPVIQKFLASGGGVFVFADLFRGTVYPYWNALMEPFGITLIPDKVIETDLAKQQHLKNYYDQLAYLTTNISPSPITEGVHEFWYPDNHTVTFDADENWKIAVRASETAHSEHTAAMASSAKTYPSVPPLIAYRTVGSGRMVVFSTHSSYYTLNPYHFTWDNGFFLNEGDGYRLIMNINNWLAESSVTSGELGGFTESEQKQFFDLDVFREESFPPTVTSVLEGGIKKTLIGVQTTYSGGKYTVKDFADAAKKLGIDMLVFTENPDALDKETWLKLASDCEAVSTDTFLAMPGVRFTGLETASEGVAFNLKKPWYDISYKDTGFHTYVRIGVTTGWSSSVATVYPSTNPMSIYNMGAVTGYTLFSYDGSKLVDTDVETFLQTSNEGWELFPMSYAAIDNPDDLANLKDAYFTYFYYPRMLNSFVSNGPIIDYIKAESPYHWIQVQDKVVTFSFKVHSDVPLQKVEVIANGKTLRTFYPDAETCEQSFRYRTNENAYFYLIATDADGHTAYSRTVSNYRYWYRHYIGTDRMNGYCYPVTPAEPEVAFSKAGKFIITGTSFYPGLGWGDQIPIRSGPQYGSRPVGPEIGPPTGGLSGVELIPLIYLDDTSEFNPAAPYRRVSLNSTDCIILRDTIDKVVARSKDDTGRASISTPPSQYLRGDVVATAFRCPSTFFMTIEATLEAKQDFDIDATKENYMYLIPYAGFADTYSSIVSKNGLEPLKVVDYAFPAQYELAGGSFIGLVDNPFGVGALFTFDPTDVAISQNGQFPRLYAFPPLDSMHVKRGQKLHSKYLLVFTQGNDGNPIDIFQTVYDKYGFDGTPASEITVKTGKLTSYLFTPELVAADYGVHATFTKAELPAGLGLKVHGCNPNWDVSLYDVAQEQLLRNVTMDEGVVYVNLDVSGDRDVFIGNLITSDNENLFINVYEASPEKLTITVHNPTDKTITATITTAPGLGIPEVPQTITLAPGQSQDLEFAAGAQ